MSNGGKAVGAGDGVAVLVAVGDNVAVAVGVGATGGVMAGAPRSEFVTVRAVAWTQAGWLRIQRTA